jgi:hypothetical protein
MTIQQYCDRVVQPNFWGGESELLVLTSLLKQPVTVYVPAAGGRALGYSPIVSYGTQFSTSKSGKERKFVKLLYSNGCVRWALQMSHHAAAGQFCVGGRCHPSSDLVWRLTCSNHYDLLL